MWKIQGPLEDENLFKIKKFGKVICQSGLCPKPLKILLSHKEEGFRLSRTDFTAAVSAKLPSLAFLVILVHTQVWEQLL